jgi:hypothetical protein
MSHYLDLQQVSLIQRSTTSQFVIHLILFHYCTAKPKLRLRSYYVKECKLLCMKLNEVISIMSKSN